MNTEAIKELKRLAEAALVDGNGLNAMSLSEFKQCQADKRAYPKAANPVAIKSLIAKLEAAQADLAAIRALEIFGYWFTGEKRFASVSEARAYFDDSEQKEMLKPLYALPEQK